MPRKKKAARQRTLAKYEKAIRNLQQQLAEDDDHPLLVNASEALEAAKAFITTYEAISDKVHIACAAQWLLNHGHGHVFENDNGYVARCGGPPGCTMCRLEQQLSNLMGE